MSFIVWPIFYGFIYLFFLFSKWIEDWLIWDILSIGLGLLCIYCLAMTAVNIKKIKNGTYFTITTDVLRQKETCYNLPTSSVMRLQFQCDRFEILCRYSSAYDQAYNMQRFTIYDTAFIGNTFTLIKVKKRVALAYNNKLFDVQY